MPLVPADCLLTNREMGGGHYPPCGSRSNRHSSEPAHDCGDECEPLEVDESPVIARGEAAEMFEFVEASFDAISLFIGFGIVRDDGLAGWV